MWGLTVSTAHSTAALGSSYPKKRHRPRAFLKWPASGPGRGDHHAPVGDEHELVVGRDVQNGHMGQQLRRPDPTLPPDHRPQQGPGGSNPLMSSWPRPCRISSTDRRAHSPSSPASTTSSAGTGAPSSSEIRRILSRSPTSGGTDQPVPPGLEHRLQRMGVVSGGHHRCPGRDVHIRSAGPEIRRSPCSSSSSVLCGVYYITKLWTN